MGRDYLEVLATFLMNYKGKELGWLFVSSPGSFTLACWLFIRLRLAVLAFSLRVSVFSPSCFASTDFFKTSTSLSSSL